MPTTTTASNKGASDYEEGNLNANRHDERNQPYNIHDGHFPVLSCLNTIRGRWSVVSGVA